MGRKNTARKTRQGAPATTKLGAGKIESNTHLPPRQAAGILSPNGSTGSLDYAASPPRRPHASSCEASSYHNPPPSTGRNNNCSNTPRFPPRTSSGETVASSTALITPRGSYRDVLLTPRGSRGGSLDPPHSARRPHSAPALPAHTNAAASEVSQQQQQHQHYQHLEASQSNGIALPTDVVIQSPGVMDVQRSPPKLDRQRHQKQKHKAEAASVDVELAEPASLTLLPHGHQHRDEDDEDDEERSNRGSESKGTQEQQQMSGENERSQFKPLATVDEGSVRQQIDTTLFTVMETQVAFAESLTSLQCLAARRDELQRQALELQLAATKAQHAVAASTAEVQRLESTLLGLQTSLDIARQHVGENQQVAAELRSALLNLLRLGARALQLPSVVMALEQVASLTPPSAGSSPYRSARQTDRSELSSARYETPAASARQGDDPSWHDGGGPDHAETATAENGRHGAGRDDDVEVERDGNRKAFTPPSKHAAMMNGGGAASVVRVLGNGHSVASSDAANGGPSCSAMTTIKAAAFVGASKGKNGKVSVPKLKLPGTMMMNGGETSPAMAPGSVSRRKAAGASSSGRVSVAALQRLESIRNKIEAAEDILSARSPLT